MRSSSNKNKSGQNIPGQNIPGQNIPGKGRTVLITGCSSGIGRHCALQLQKHGWAVTATARKKADIAELEGLGLHALYLDYAEPHSIETAFAQTLEHHQGRLYALFNNGAYAQPGAVEDLTTETLRQQFEANFFGWHHLTNLVLPHLLKSGEGRIVHCSSILGFVPFAWRGAYNASKFALEGLASTMRLELHDTNIRISLIQPGPIRSKISQNSLPHFTEKVDIKASRHHEAYRKRFEDLNSQGGANRFRLGPEAVYKALDHALCSDRPKAHYRVTTPTKFMALAKRALPQNWIDTLLIKNS